MHAAFLLFALLPLVADAATPFSMPCRDMFSRMRVGQPFNRSQGLQMRYPGAPFPPPLLQQGQIAAFQVQLGNDQVLHLPPHKCWTLNYGMCSRVSNPLTVMGRGCGTTAGAQCQAFMGNPDEDTWHFTMPAYSKDAPHSAWETVQLAREGEWRWATRTCITLYASYTEQADRVCTVPTTLSPNTHSCNNVDAWMVQFEVLVMGSDNDAFVPYWWRRALSEPTNASVPEAVDRAQTSEIVAYTARDDARSAKADASSARSLATAAFIFMLLVVGFVVYIGRKTEVVPCLGGRQNARFQPMETPNMYLEPADALETDGDELPPVSGNLP